MKRQKYHVATKNICKLLHYKLGSKILGTNAEQLNIYTDYILDIGEEFDPEDLPQVYLPKGNYPGEEKIVVNVGPSAGKQNINTTQVRLTCAVGYFDGGVPPGDRSYGLGGLNSTLIMAPGTRVLLEWGEDVWLIKTTNLWNFAGITPANYYSA